VATARWVAKTLQYPATNPQLSGPAWPWALTLRPILLAAAAVTAAWGIRVLRRRRRVPHRGVEGSARGTGWPRQRKQRIARPASSHPSS
jgi:hypothetical protein